MAIGQIPWRDTLLFAQHYGLDDYDTESLIDLIERLDHRELAKMADEGNKNGKDSASKRRD